MLSRITLPGALYLGIVAVLPNFFFSITGGNNQNFPFGGTAVLIMVGVGLDTVKQIESQLMQRNYEGFPALMRRSGREGECIVWWAAGRGQGHAGRVHRRALRVPKISTGDIFRANVCRGTDWPDGQEVHGRAATWCPTRSPTRWCATGSPSRTRTTGSCSTASRATSPQAKELDELLAELGAPLSWCSTWTVDFDEVVSRLSGRRTCKKCGHVWHLEFDPPKTDGVCDLCGGELYQRDDDQPETVRHRLDVYADQTAPLVDFYRDAGSWSAIDALGPVEDVTERAIAALEPFAD